MQNFTKGIWPWPLTSVVKKRICAWVIKNARFGERPHAFISGSKMVTKCTENVQNFIKKRPFDFQLWPHLIKDVRTKFDRNPLNIQLFRGESLKNHVWIVFGQIHQSLCQARLLSQDRSVPKMGRRSLSRIWEAVLTGGGAPAATASCNITKTYSHPHFMAVIAIFH